MGVASKISKTASAPGATLQERDADHINPDQWPVRALPAKVTGRNAQYQVVFAQNVVDDIRLHGESSPDAEVCGVLVGNIYHDQAGPYCFVKANIRGNNAPGRNAQVTFTSETWTQIHEQMEAHYTDQKIVGWYHTHPGFGIFLSEMDLFIQNNFFNEVWQIAYVDDPKGGDRGVFVWQDGAAVRRPYLIDPGIPEVGASDGSEQPVTGERRRSASTDALASAARIRTLQKQLARQKSRGRLSLIIAFFWPLIMLAILVRTGVVPADKLKGLIPTRATVDKWTGKLTGAGGQR